MSNPVEFWRDCYLDGMSISRCDQLVSTVFYLDGKFLSDVSDRGLVAANKEYARMEANRCVS